MCCPANQVLWMCVVLSFNWLVIRAFTFRRNVSSLQNGNYPGYGGLGSLEVEFHNDLILYSELPAWRWCCGKSWGKAWGGRPELKKKTKVGWRPEKRKVEILDNIFPFRKTFPCFTSSKVGNTFQVNTVLPFEPLGVQIKKGFLVGAVKEVFSLNLVPLSHAITLPCLGSLC